MPLWLRLAWKEFWLPFRYRKSGCPGGRDFVWLTTFMALMLTLFLLLLASREGLLNRFVDVLLGNVPGYGVPISVTNNMLSKGGANAIDTEVLAEMNALNAEIPGLKVFPYRPLEAILHPLIALPDEAIWQNKHNDNKFGPDFDGWAVYPEDPLWKGDTSRVLPLEITMSRSLFSAYFNYGAYRNALRHELPDDLFDAIPAVFEITDKTILRLEKEHFPHEILHHLKTMTGRLYTSENSFLHAVKQRLGEELALDQQVLILQHGTIPTDDKMSKAPFTHLWLRVNVGFSRELFRFKVTWVERFPIIEKIAYLFPLTTYQALKAAHDFPELRYYPEGLGEGGERFRQILIESPMEADEQTFLQSCHDFAARVGGELTAYRGDVLIRFKHPKRQAWLDAYAAQYHLHYESLETFFGDLITCSEGKIILPCGRIPRQYLRENHGSGCCSDMKQPLEFDITARGNGFHYALVYVPDRTFLTRTVERLHQLKENALTIHSAYQDALNRFGFLSEMLKAMEKPYSWFLVLFLVAFLGVQIGTLIGHHRHRYGVLLAKGIDWWQLYAMLWMQIGLAMGIGMVVALAVITAGRIYLQQNILPVANRYAATLSVVDLNLLPLSAKAFWGASALVLGSAWILATLILLCLPLRRNTHPATLLQ